MIGLPEFKKEYFEKFSTKQVLIKPYDPKSKVIAQEYVNKLKSLLEGFDFEIAHRGSTAFGISGKGDIEIGVYPAENCWYQLLEKLINHYKSVGCLENNYARFNDVYDNFEIEVILMKGHEAIVDKKIARYLKEHPPLLKKYEKLKVESSFSKRNYQIQKDLFFRKNAKQIPDNY
ncbi:hypothetical protein COY33_01875 [candidate division WWE3 bacterium CG_4_10_14_0_2_um_filter_42_7]|uniref:GrpB family protein n=1 Tax=candidate division WWE3 bacterium CG_4_10_14_0_2_um_filter_42_7 TaxID=1975073 RepID=A0A2M7TCX8_UNCKA|nr:MAG: hypothetical protein COY33_01875 [candidate division WWE3 bacterium CG_4_10_14_0_2_um_filter_42_7]